MKVIVRMYYKSDSRKKYTIKLHTFNYNTNNDQRPLTAALPTTGRLPTACEAI